MTQNIHISITQHDLLGAIKARVAQALSCDNMADPVKTVATIVLTVLAICAIGAAHFTPITHKRNAVITVIFRPNGVSHSLSRCGKQHYSSYSLKELPLGLSQRPHTCRQSSQGCNESTCHGWGHSGDRLYRWDTLPGSFRQRSLWSRAGRSVSRSSLGHRWCTAPLSPCRAADPCSAHTWGHKKKNKKKNLYGNVFSQCSGIFGKQELILADYEAAPILHWCPVK